MTRWLSPITDHYIIVELANEQIEIFLPNWFRASVRRERRIDHDETKEILVQDAQERANQLIMTIKHNHGVRMLAENPLLLTLLAVMQTK